jgi:transposase
MTADSTTTAATTANTAIRNASSKHNVGLDVHARRSSVCVLNGDGKQVRRFEVRGDWPALLARVAADVPRPFAVCYEASCGYGYLHGRLSQLADRVAVAHPGKLRLIYGDKRKNDRVDAAKVAKLLYLDAVPQVHVPSADVRAWRGLVEYRRRLVDRRVAVKNQVRALLRGLGVGGVPAGKALWSGKGLAWLRALTLDDDDDDDGTGGADALRRDLLADELSELTARVERVERELDARADRHPGVALLRTDEPGRRGPHRRGGRRLPGRRAPLRPRAAGRLLPGLGAVPGRQRGAGPPGAHHPRRPGHRPQAAVRGGVAVGPAEPGDAGVLRAGRRRQAGPAEGRAGRGGAQAVPRDGRDAQERRGVAGVTAAAAAHGSSAKTS